MPGGARQERKKATNKIKNANQVDRICRQKRERERVKYHWGETRKRKAGKKEEKMQAR